MVIIRVHPMYKLMKKCGIKRVSNESALALGKALEDIGIRIAMEAIDFARHSGRETVKARDIEIAKRKVVKPTI